MKRIFLSLAGIAALIAVVLSVGTPQAVAQAAEVKAAPVVDSPLGRPCVVTLDPLAASETLAPQAMRDKAGFISANITEGTLVSLGPEWVVLRQGTYDHWIPRGKVLMMRVSR